MGLRRERFLVGAAIPAGKSKSACESVGIMAEQTRGALKLPFLDAVIVAARQRPDLVKKVADDWLIEQARRNARDKPGFVSGNEAGAFIELIKSNPVVAQARNRVVNF